MTVYRSYYCGLCRQLVRRHGRFGQATLSYDMTFLYLLLTSLYEEEEQRSCGRCLMHPMSRHDRRVNSCADYAADMNVLLSYYDLMDDWQDDRSLRSLAIASGIRGGLGRLSEQYPRQAEALRLYMETLGRLEREQCADIEQAAMATGRMLAEVFVRDEDMWARDLRSMGFYLGKYIYFLDAYEDIEGDLSKGSYNPFGSICQLPDFDERVKQILIMQMAECTRAFERLPVLANAGLIRNILYSGIWGRFAAAYQKKHTTGEKE